jgi:hypothetical protein
MNFKDELAKRARTIDAKATLPPKRTMKQEKAYIGSPSTKSWRVIRTKTVETDGQVVTTEKVALLNLPTEDDALRHLARLTKAAKPGVTYDIAPFEGK